MTRVGPLLVRDVADDEEEVDGDEDCPASVAEEEDDDDEVEGVLALPPEIAAKPSSRERRRRRRCDPDLPTPFDEIVSSTGPPPASPSLAACRSFNPPLRA
jgi:hypothetical protein